MKKKSIIFLFALILSSCELKYTISEKQKLANEIRIKAAIQIKKEKNLTPAGTMGQMMHEIQILGLMFNYYQKLDLKKGREMVIYAAQTLADKINEEKKIHPYLSTCPFPPQKTEIELYLYNPDGSLLPPGELSIVSLAYGIIKYEIEDPETTYLKTIYQETYEEALEKINQNLK